MKKIKLKLANKISFAYILMFIIFMIFCEFFVIYFLRKQNYENNRILYSQKIQEINDFFDKLEDFSKKYNSITLDFNPKIKNNMMIYSKPFDSNGFEYRYIVRIRNSNGYDEIPLNTYINSTISKDKLIEKIETINKSIKSSYINKNIPVNINGSANSIYTVIRISRHIGGNTFDIYILKDKTDENLIYKTLILLLTLYTLIGLVIVVFLSNKLSKNILKPINNIIQIADLISTDDLSIRITPTDTNDELDNLIEIINGMLDRLNIAFDNQSKFISDVSHELRTPLTIIRGYAELALRHGENDSKISTESLEFIVSEVNNMKDLVDKLLFLARGDASTIKLKMETFDSEDFINQLQSGSLFFIRDHNLIIERNEKYALYADKSLLLQAIRAILENCVKYSDTGTNIYIKSYYDSSRKAAVISIKDQGIGISKEYFEKVFERFYRIDESRTKQTGGTGLGLSIVKKIVSLHNGKIELKSELNKGSEFILLIPSKGNNKIEKWS
ncbi:sensor histidine kinase [Caviibacter abscessus]|uniref:sensor histidine kinase n=1 Tax=Caviibacter abscessus TaxID=1766719 RepID=UPI00082F5A70|nr:ATP-binding protein [Caviibacter abscessus]